MKVKNTLIIILLMLPCMGFAQVVPPPMPPPPPPGLPIDGFSGVLIALGIIYGVKQKYKDSSS